MSFDSSVSVLPSPVLGFWGSAALRTAAMSVMTSWLRCIVVCLVRGYPLERKALCLSLSQSVFLPSEGSGADDTGNNLDGLIRVPWL